MIILQVPTEEIKKFTVNIQKMQSVYEYYQNLALRNTVVSNFKATEKLDIIQGYIPADKEANFKAYLKSFSIKDIFGN